MITERLSTNAHGFRLRPILTGPLTFLTCPCRSHDFFFSFGKTAPILFSDIFILSSYVRESRAACHPDSGRFHIPLESVLPDTIRRVPNSSIGRYLATVLQIGRERNPADGVRRRGVSVRPIRIFVRGRRKDGICHHNRHSRVATPSRYPQIPRQGALPRFDNPEHSEFYPSPNAG